MKIARVETTDGPRTALVEGDVLRLAPSGTEVRALLGEPSRFEPTGETMPLEGARLLAPVAAAFDP